MEKKGVRTRAESEWEGMVVRQELVNNNMGKLDTSL